MNSNRCVMFRVLGLVVFAWGPFSVVAAFVRRGPTSRCMTSTSMGRHTSSD